MYNLKIKPAFSILELSVVILVIAVLISISLKSINILDNLESKTMLKNVTSYEAAMQNFYDSYKALPGDMDNASTLISSSISNDGDSNSETDIKSDDEDIYAFEHMYYAEIISFKPVYQASVPVGEQLSCGADGTFSGTERLYPTYNIPEVLPDKAAIAIHSSDANGSDPFFYFVIGNSSSCLYQNRYFTEGVLTPKQMYQIYMKYDGEMPLPSDIANNGTVNTANFNKIQAITDNSGDSCDYDNLNGAVNKKSCYFMYKGIFENNVN